MKNQNEVLTMAVASYDGSWLRVIANYFQERKEFGKADYYARGEQLLCDMAGGQIPQVVILDEQMQDIDLLTFMQGYAALSLSQKPILLGLCHKRYLGYTGNLISLGLTDFLAKPVSLSAIAARVLLLQHTCAGGEIKAFCDALYEQWGLAWYENTVYLTDVMKIASDTTEKLAIRKEIVWQVAALRGCSSNAVDLALRRLIDKLETTAAPAYLAFKQEMGFGTAKPTVGALLYAMQHKFTMERTAHGASSASTAHNAQVALTL